MRASPAFYYPRRRYALPFAQDDKNERGGPRGIKRRKNTEVRFSHLRIDLQQFKFD